MLKSSGPIRKATAMRTLGVWSRGSLPPASIRALFFVVCLFRSYGMESHSCHTPSCTHLPVPRRLQPARQRQVLELYAIKAIGVHLAGDVIPNDLSVHGGR